MNELIDKIEALVAEQSVGPEEAVLVLAAGNDNIRSVGKGEIKTVVATITAHMLENQDMAALILEAVRWYMKELDGKDKQEN